MTLCTEILRVERLVKRYPGTVVLDIDSSTPLRFDRGIIHALVGENGAGKSTMMGILAGVIPPDESVIILDGEAFEPSGVPYSRSRGIEIVRQDSGLVLKMSVEENLYLGREDAFRSYGLLWPKRRHVLAEAALAKIGLKFRATELVSSLSLEDQKFVELARALVFRPKVLIIDEMTAALSRQGVEKLFEVLRGLALSGIAILYVSHYLEEVFSLCDHITVLKDGRVVKSLRAEDADVDRLSTLMVGRSTKNIMYHEDLRAVSSSDCAIQVDHLTVQGAFQDFSLSLHSGEIVGVAGLIGCGSEELGLALFGNLAPTAGKLTLNRRAYRPKNPRQAIARGVVLVPSDRDRYGLVLRLSIADNITLAALPWLTWFGFRSSTEDSSLARRLIERLQIACRGPKDLPFNLSGGNRQKVVFAKWMVRDNEVLILHNPTRGVDVGAKEEIYRIIRLLTQQGQAVLLISDDMQELLGLSDRVIVMRRGHISAELSRQNALTEELVVSHML